MYFEFNGVACLQAERMLKELSRLGLDDSAWEGKANSFTHRRGVEPSFGYLLCESSAVIDEDGNLVEEGNLIIKNETYDEEADDGSRETIYNQIVLVQSAEAVYGAAAVDYGFYVVRVVDTRERWKREYLDKDARYNMVTGDDEEGEYEFEDDTAKVISESLTNPWKFWELFEEIASEPSIAVTDSENPGFEPKPQDEKLSAPHNLDFRYWNVHAALSLLLKQCACTIVPNSPPTTGTYPTYTIDFIRNEETEGGQSTKLIDALNQYNFSTDPNWRMVRENHPLQGRRKRLIPYDVDFIFPSLEGITNGDIEDDFFTLNKDSTATDALKDVSYRLQTQINQIYIEDSKHTSEDTNEHLLETYTDKLLELYKQLWDTYSDIRESFYVGTLSGVALMPSSFIYSISWEDLGEYHHQVTTIVPVAELELDLRIKPAEPIEPAEPGTPTQYAIIKGTVPAAEYTNLDDDDPEQWTIDPGTLEGDDTNGAILITTSGEFEDDSDPPYLGVINMSPTPFNGTQWTPGHMDGDDFVILSHNFNSSNNYDNSKTQILYHQQEDSAYYLGGEDCGG